jgi:hypothetical protein
MSLLCQTVLDEPNQCEPSSAHARCSAGEWWSLCVYSIPPVLQSSSMSTGRTVQYSHMTHAQQSLHGARSRCRCVIWREWWFCSNFKRDRQHGIRALQRWQQQADMIICVQPLCVGSTITAAIGPQKYQGLPGHDSPTLFSWAKSAGNMSSAEKMVSFCTRSLFVLAPSFRSGGIHRATGRYICDQLLPYLVRCVYLLQEERRDQLSLSQCAGATPHACAWRRMFNRREQL